MDVIKEQQIVFKNDGEIPVDEILCTTYQMRNFYLQMRDGFFTDLDVMNYIQHFKAVKMMKKDFIVLDVCCGRGLLLPLMRYHAKEIKKYIGVDIEPKNLTSKTKDIRSNKPIDAKEFYPFDVEWVISNVADMASKIKEKVDFIVYTSAIEHMHKEHGLASLGECSKLLKKNGSMFLSCPNTPENQNGFDVRYKAHVYEWKLSELRLALKKVGFEIQKEIGICGSVKVFRKALEKAPKPIRDFFEPALDYIPKEFLEPLLFANFPELAKEVLLIVKKI
ncbi:MAG TPA: methyltransferase domain-containing protein [Candidatus Bathyarchaeia archaeon]|nr:methyltransferase domain-containing protein [Candidatus Bathyarchaeia archaeon]